MTDNVIVVIVLAIIGTGGVGALVAQLLKARPEVRDLESKITERVLALADSRMQVLINQISECSKDKEELIEKIDKLQEDHFHNLQKIYDLEHKVYKLEGRIQRLVEQIKGAGLEPVNGQNAIS